MGYLNKHHEDALRAFAETFSELGVEQAKKNAWSGGSYKIESAKIVDINLQQFELEVSIQERVKQSVKRVTVDLGKPKIWRPTKKRRFQAFNLFLKSYLFRVMVCLKTEHQMRFP